MKKLNGRTVEVSALSEVHRRQMFVIMNDYYAGMSWDSFEKDLNEKNYVILLETTTEIVGFSTLLCKTFEVQKKKVIGVFSGDTVLKKEYWGTPALGVRFLEYLGSLKLKHPFTPVYWFLISKGYKTYLLMANNFRDSFPRPERETPPFEQELRNQFYSEKFGDQYNPETGIVRFNTEDKCRLKEFVAPITDEMRERSPRLRYFETLNPRWNEGDELACITCVDFQAMIFTPLVYLFKRVIFGKKKKKSRTPVVINALPQSARNAEPAQGQKRG